MNHVDRVGNVIKTNRRHAPNVLDISGCRYLDLHDNDFDALSSKVKTSSNIVFLYRNWYIIDGKMYYFKGDYIFNELFFSELSKAMGVKCVDFSLAKDNDNFGIISKSFKSQNKRYYTFHEFCKKIGIDSSTNCLSSFPKSVMSKYPSNMVNSLMDDIYKLESFDFFTGQYDRWNNNVYLEENKRNLRLSPLFDNGCAFSTNEYVLDSCFDRLFFPFDNNIDPAELYTLYLIKNNKIFYDTLSYSLDIDISDVIKRTILKYRIDIMKEEKQRIIKYFDKKKSIIEHTLKLTHQI